MLKYENQGHVISIRLPEKYGYNGYSAECRYFYDTSIEKYILSMWLKRDDFNGKFGIDSQEIDMQPISGTRETIRQNICRIVEEMCITGAFEPFVERFEHTYKCFSIGASQSDNERTDAA